MLLYMYIFSTWVGGFPCGNEVPLPMTSLVFPYEYHLGTIIEMYNDKFINQNWQGFFFFARRWGCGGDFRFR